jgi:APA family basic amino acid/polyamine antiporter
MAAGDIPPPAGAASESGDVGLVRTLTLTHAVLYGLGVTIGAGIYVLVGPAIGRAGAAAPYAFAIAAVLMAFTAASFAELATRMPVAAGEAAYVAAGFRARWPATVTGLRVVAMSIVSAAAISVGAAGYISHVLPWPHLMLVAGVVLLMGFVAAWGIKESVTLAGLMTLIEVGGLLVIVVAGAVAGPYVPDANAAVPTPSPLQTPYIFAGLASTTLLAVFAFVGFEGIANVAEEVKRPERDLPLAFFLTLAITTVLYMAVIWVALRSAGQSEMAGSNAPLTLVFQRVTGGDARIMTAIAIVATMNGIIVQTIMAARVLYGLSRQGSLPRALGHVSRVTRTPVIATAVTVAITLVLALLVPLDRLADWTAQLTLVIFTIINAALVMLKLRDPAPQDGVFVVPLWVPCAGIISTAGILLATAVL